MSAEENLQRMKTLDDAWNAQDWDVFRKRHSADTKVLWPGQPEPTRGRDAHQAESEVFFKSIENHLDNNPYRVMFGSGDWTCTIARWKGKMIGPWKDLDGEVHDATERPSSWSSAPLRDGRTARLSRRTCSTTRLDSSGKSACFSSFDEGERPYSSGCASLIGNWIEWRASDESGPERDEARAFSHSDISI
jgi:hypothetical protein